MDFKKLTTRFRQFGGFRLMWEYAKLGAILPAVRTAWRFTVHGEWFKVGVFQCCKEIYGTVILEKVEPFLERKYAPVVQGARLNVHGEKLEHKRSKVIWFCWLQGLNEAPEIVRVCYHSLTRHLVKVQGYRLQVIDGKNWKEFVKLPEYVVRKWEKGRIPAANFSDLLRLELLIKYGGTWIDSTVLCTGVNENDNENDNLGSPDGSKSLKNHQELENGKISTSNSELKHKMLEYLDADLFLFQYTPEGTTEGISISNWFITSCTNNEVLMAVRDMLYAYWKEYDCTIDYYMFHLFFEMVAREFPEQVGAMPYGSSQRSIALMRHWDEPFNQEQWDRLVSKVAFHKLSHRVSEEVKNNKDNYYNYIIYDLRTR